ncbi:MFS transporter [Escherichia coli]|nr:MFS transporter [Escherichia coli]ELE0703386.1 MFS transporter [Escherichia coli]
MILDTVDEKKKGVHTRYLILLIIFIVTAVNYADRATLSIAGTEVAKELQLSAVSMGYIFSAFGWAYLLMQIPGGWLLDKFGSKKVYTYSLFFWSLFTFLQGFVDMFPLAWAGISMFFMRFMLGFSEAPSFPANARIVAAWFPIYLVQEKGMSILKVGLVASIPALCGFAGGVLGGVFSDYLIKRGLSLTLARKLPIVLGMLLASTIILCNYTNNTTLVVMLMALAFFGKGFGALGWPVISDTAPKEIVGLCGGVFNVFGNVASIVTPLVIGYLVSELHSFNAALVFVGCSALMAMVCYLFVVGDIKRMELQK